MMISTKGKKKKISSGMILVHLVLLLGTVTMLLPFVWMFLASFKTYQEVMRIPIVWLPGSWNLNNYIEVLRDMNFGHYFVNTFTVTLLTTAIQLTFCSLTAYGFARLRFPGRDVIFFGFICLLMVPTQMLIVPRYIMMVKLKWLNSYAALIVPHYVSIYGTFLLRQYFMALPRDLEDAAKIDGCGYLQIFLRILMPLMTNACLALVVYTVVFNWNELLWPLLVLNSEKLRTLAIGIASMRDEHTVPRHLMMTAGVISTFPLILTFAVGQKKLIESMALSGIKG